MTEIWGHWLPAGKNGKGLGNRQLFRALRDAFVMHDMSYFWSMRLSGSREGMLGALKHVCDGTLLPTDPNVAPQEQILCLHAKGRFPRGLLSPLLITWLPAKSGAPASCLLWVHCAAYRACESALHSAVAAAQAEPPPSCGAVSLESLEGRLQRIEVRGSEAAMRPLLCDRPALLPGGRGAPRVAVTWALDPRLFSVLQSFARLADPEHTVATLCSTLWEARNDAARNGGNGGEGAVLTAFDGTPASQADVDALHPRAKLLKDVLGPITAIDYAHCPIGIVRRGGGEGVREGNVEGEGGAFGGGYALLLPRRWAMPFWLHLARAGGLACGLREWKWLVHAASAIPIFPDAFPDAPHACTHPDSWVEAATGRARGPFRPLDWGRCIPEAAAGEGGKGEKEGEGGGEGEGDGGDASSALFVARTPRILRQALFGGDGTCEGEGAGLGALLMRAVRKPGEGVRGKGKEAGWGWMPSQALRLQQSPSCLVKLAIQPVRKGTVGAWDEVCGANEGDMRAAFRRTLECGEEGDAAEARPLLGYVTLAAPPRTAKGVALAGEAHCHAQGVWRTISQQRQHRRALGHCDLVVMLRCGMRDGNPGTLRPAFATIVFDG